MKARVRTLLRALTDRAEVFRHVGKYDSGINDLEAILAMCDKTKYKDQRFQSKTNIAIAEYQQEGKSEYKKAAQRLRMLIKTQGKRLPRVLRAHIFRNLGIIAEYTGRYSQALGYFKKAMSIYQKLRNIRGIRNTLGSLGSLCSAQGDIDGALAYFKKDLHLSKQMHDKLGIASGYNNIGFIYHDIGQLENALKYYNSCLSIFTAIGLKYGQGVVANNIGVLFYDKGMPNVALPYYRTYLSVAQQIGEKRTISIALGNIGRAYRDTGHVNMALEHFNKQLTIAHQIGYRRGECIAYGNLGLCAFDRAKLNIARAHFKKQMLVAKQIGYQHGLIMVYQNMGMWYLVAGKPRQASTCYTLQKTLSHRLKFSKGSALAEEFAGRLCLLRGHKDKALNYLRKALDYFVGEQSGLHVAEIHTMLGLIMIQQRQFDKAIFYARQALVRAEEGELLLQKIHALRVLGRALGADDLQASIECFAQAVRLAKTSQLPFEYARALYDWAAILKQEGSGRAAAKKFKESRSIFKRIRINVNNVL